MTVLSRLRMNPRSRDARRDLGDCEQMHRTVMRAFPSDAGKSPRQGYGVLYRVEVDLRGHPSLLLQSSGPPKWSHIPAGYLVSAPESKSVEMIYDRLADSQRLVFRLRANATKRASKNENDPRWHGKRVDLRSEEDQLKWLQRKASEAGFSLRQVRIRPGLGASEAATIPNVSVVTSGKVVGRVARVPADRLTFGSVLFDGLLEISDRSRFVHALTVGIGPGKAYGFGLLSIAPA
jgi:CRISPR system Cascade subunit CasE